MRTSSTTINENLSNKKRKLPLWIAKEQANFESSNRTDLIGKSKGKKYFMHVQKSDSLSSEPAPQQSLKKQEEKCEEKSSSSLVKPIESTIEQVEIAMDPIGFHKKLLQEIGGMLKDDDINKRGDAIGCYIKNMMKTKLSYLFNDMPFTDEEIKKIVSLYKHKETRDLYVFLRKKSYPRITMLFFTKNDCQLLNLMEELATLEAIKSKITLESKRGESQLSPVSLLGKTELQILKDTLSPLGFVALTGIGVNILPQMLQKGANVTINEGHEPRFRDIKKIVLKKAGVNLKPQFYLPGTALAKAAATLRLDVVDLLVQHIMCTPELIVPYMRKLTTKALFALSNSYELDFVKQFNPSLPEERYSETRLAIVEKLRDGLANISAVIPCYTDKPGKKGEIDAVFGFHHLLIDAVREADLPLVEYITRYVIDPRIGRMVLSTRYDDASQGIIEELAATGKTAAIERIIKSLIGFSSRSFVVREQISEERSSEPRPDPVQKKKDDFKKLMNDTFCNLIRGAKTFDTHIINTMEFLIKQGADINVGVQAALDSFKDEAFQICLDLGGTLHASQLIDKEYKHEDRKNRFTKIYQDHLKKMTRPAVDALISDLQEQKSLMSDKLTIDLYLAQILLTNFNCNSDVINQLGKENYDNHIDVLKRLSDCKDINILKKIAEKADYAPVYRSKLNADELKLESKDLEQYLVQATKLGNLSLLKDILKLEKINRWDLWSLFYDFGTEATALCFMDAFKNESFWMQLLGTVFLKNGWYEKFDILVKELKPELLKAEIVFMLEELADKGNLDAIKYVFPKLNHYLAPQTDTDFFLVFMKACCSDNLELVKYLAERISADCLGPWSVERAIDHNQIEIAKYLLIDRKVKAPNLDTKKIMNSATAWFESYQSSWGMPKFMVDWLKPRVVAAESKPAPILEDNLDRREEKLNAWSLKEQAKFALHKISSLFGNSKGSPFFNHVEKEHEKSSKKMTI